MALRSRSDALDPLLEYIKTARGFDFTGYKRPSLERRIEKRMQVVRCESFEEYAAYLKTHPDEFVDHNPVWGTTTWHEVVASTAMLRAAMPDLRVEVERDIVVAEGDQVEIHSILTGTHTGGELFGVAASGKQATWTGNDFLRFAGGKIVERWVSADTLTLFQQPLWVAFERSSRFGDFRSCRRRAPDRARPAGY